ncbi:2-amino-4-hydroxy-6-hydroxymethyldihydropteridine diphosphokinase [Sphingobium cloacae]|uniref:2-amino-4-hydroxy-6-hydroxymethyldihydropteridine pyrophosphokinase n=1 Tax=Sphingobium cloacae TaxID=120107 RepID=A0A1E1EZH8_9SPHN|nr:2-amino-4-hydroxy-6-hydroxymethyldihydropteridine diphosphokinase [Sphingobium cloacae]BAV63621.1 2-amino-4-hydroxy-6-hydroxymethyldihydropteridine pyrophosphokinase [Sphingobium cloacae]
MPGTSHPYAYALSLGSNRALSASLPPARLLREAMERMGELGRVSHASPLFTTPPLGPSRRLFTNAALLLETSLAPEELLRALQELEQAMGRRRFRRWGARTIDIDIILWSGGRWASRSLLIPHPAFRTRDFVLKPLLSVAPQWRDPRSGWTVRHLGRRLMKAKTKDAAKG